jgi:23S rRNA (uracil1939-C5)-methyltransferase/tRNA (uracil-5-)-methyltransferase
MRLLALNDAAVPVFPKETVTPPCPIFGSCGGCQYQDIPYHQELRMKDDRIRQLLTQRLNISGESIQGIVASPQPYHYRCRLDMRLLRTRQGEVIFGFSSAENRRIIPVESCAIAMSAISRFLPGLKRQAVERLPKNYRNANLVVKTGDDGRVFWGGIGRRSLRMAESDYLWTEIHGKRIHFSLDTFFQANLSILPGVISSIMALGRLDKHTIFYDLYGGVGLFGVCFYDAVDRVICLEENPYAVKMAEFNRAYHHYTRMEILEGRLENHLTVLLANDHRDTGKRRVVMIDPPRQGLGDPVVRALAAARKIDDLLYLSCHPESLIRDLSVFCDQGWRVYQVIPFDFFPRTRHMEILAVLEPS